jgi:hypothetical protein
MKRTAAGTGKKIYLYSHKNSYIHYFIVRGMTNDREKIKTFFEHIVDKVCIKSRITIIVVCI